jgi:uncharacterized protein (TIGR00369 family)
MPDAPLPRLPVLDDYADYMNALPGGFVRVLGLHFVTASAAEVTATLTVTETHLQPYGIVHGGVHAALVESVASVGAALQWVPRGEWVVGVENRTRFLRPVRAGTVLRAVGRPRPEPSQSGQGVDAAGDPIWLVDVADEAGRLVASGQLRLRRLPPDTELSGRPVGISGTAGVDGPRVRE